MQLEQTGWMEVRDKLKNPQGIIMATGSTEQHGPIGLIGTDTICSETIASGAAAKANMFLAPSIGFTPAEFNMKFPGTISVSVQTFKSLLREVTSSLLKHGFKYVLIVNGHGANIDPIKEVMINFNNKLFFKSWWDFPTVNDIRNKEFGDWEGMHATPSEISITQILKLLAGATFQKSSIPENRVTNLQLVLKKLTLLVKPKMKGHMKIVRDSLVTMKRKYRKGQLLSIKWKI